MIELKNCVQIPHYSLIDAIAEDFTEIAVSRTMLADHMPEKYYQEMQNVLKARLDAVKMAGGGESIGNPLVDESNGDDNGNYLQEQ